MPASFDSAMVSWLPSSVWPSGRESLTLREPRVAPAPAMFNLPSGGAFFEDGTFRPLGVAHPERLDSLPDVPTLRELGIEMDHSTSRGIFAPKGTPQEVLDIIAAAYGQALENENLPSRIENEFGSVVRFLAGDDYLEFLEENEAALSAAAENIDFQN